MELLAGHRVVFHNGFVLGDGASLEVVIDPSLSTGDQ